MILRDRVKVERKQIAAVSPTGGVKQGAPAVIYALLKCDLQPDRSAVIMPPVGQTIISFKIMFCNTADIQMNDIVTDLSTQERFKVIDVNPYGLLKHLEIRLQGGVA